MKLLSLEQHKLQCFEQMFYRIQANPDDYLNFDHVSDVYKATWLDDFPKGTTWAVSGLDDGAEEFNLLISYKDKKIMIEIKYGSYKIHMNV